MGKTVLQILLILAGLLLLGAGICFVAVTYNGHH